MAMKQELDSYFILYNDKEKFYKFFEYSGLEGSIIFRIKSVKDAMDLTGNGRAMESMVHGKRIIMPDFHENPEAKEIIEILIPAMSVAGIGTAYLEEYKAKKFGKASIIGSLPQGEMFVISAGRRHGKSAIAQQIYGKQITGVWTDEDYEIAKCLRNTDND